MRIFDVARLAMFGVAEVGAGLLVLLAQAGPDPISGGAGWVGAGLLGAVMAWLLLVHLPNKDKQLKEFIDSRDKDKQAAREAFEKEQRESRSAFALAIREQQAAFALAVNDQQKLFGEEQKQLRVYHGQEMKEMRQMVLTISQHFRDAVHDIKGAGQVVVSRADVAVKEAKQLVEQARERSHE